MHIEDSKMDILNEAGKSGNQICKVKNGDQAFVKIRRGYSEPEDLRVRYIDALSDLVKRGFVSEVFTTADLSLYEVNASATECVTVESAKTRILDELKEHHRVYKIHSDRGEFIQLRNLSFNENEAIRIAYIRAMHKLLYKGTVRVSSESREMTSYELAAPQSHFVQYYHKIESPTQH